MKLNSIQNAIDIIRGKKKLKIYPPIYNERTKLGANFPDIYNKFGKKMDVFFLRDRHFSTAPYGTNPTHFLWDRYNYGLNTHFYTGNAMHETMGTPNEMYSFLLEPRTKQPKDYSDLEKNKHLSKKFTKILTHDARLLDNVENAEFFPGCAAAWAKPLEENAYQNKTKNISIISSHKTMCPLHHLRLSIANKCKKENLADTYGTFDGGSFVSMQDILNDYRYTIALENEISPYFYTERLISAFLTMTVPIYLGASQIDKFFNTDGIIQINVNDADNIQDVLKQCSESDYEQRLPAIKENYKKALNYLNLHDLMYETFFLNPANRKLDTTFFR